ncbi:MAG TPA: agmatine deiminase family protein [Arenimonas sp.]|uniref:agmatine deiminase family protein n=1 Tax=Arenimonas sp. TaxID=1872635 RepID=UPI002D80AA10|nr:agmatine deiminase family protein [Arenimonas sp.]HEU0153582.1 agmatine deiminase family protein [Arenimonas sp.]
MSDTLRFPAEWEPQSAVLLAWPHEGTDWAERLDGVERTYVALVAAITRFQPALVCVADGALKARAAALLAAAGVDAARLRFFEVPYDDTWLRDSGPITLREGGGFRLLDFHFTAWGGKFEAGLDDQLVGKLHASGLLAPAAHQRIDFALEGGGIETDGAGTLLSTWTCLHERHPDKTREDVTATLEQSLRQTRTLWLDHGYLEGDDTDAHIDTLARFAAPDAIVFQACDDPGDNHFTELQAMAAEIAALRQANGQPYRLFPLPWAQPILDDGRRLAASYANFLIVNGAVLMPAYGDAADTAAAAVLAAAFPGREIVPIDCRPLIWQNGSLHCVTMQLPEGLLA